MKYKELEGYLQEVTVFSNPNVHLEQYPTSPVIASHMLLTVDQVYGDLVNKSVLDLGCGCGVLSIGAALLGASYCLSVDIDSNALKQCQENVEKFELENVELLQCNVLNLSSIISKKLFDTVIMNPPFGTKKNDGIDLSFLKMASELGNDSIYSLHKTTTRQHVIKISKQLDLVPEIIAELKFDIPKMYKFHRQATKDVEVDLIRFQIKE